MWSMSSGVFDTQRYLIQRNLVYLQTRTQELDTFRRFNICNY